MPQPGEQAIAMGAMLQHDVGAELSEQRGLLSNEGGVVVCGVEQEDDRGSFFSFAFAKSCNATRSGATRRCAASSAGSTGSSIAVWRCSGLGQLNHSCSKASAAVGRFFASGSRSSRRKSQDTSLTCCGRAVLESGQHAPISARRRSRRTRAEA